MVRGLFFSQRVLTESLDKIFSPGKKSVLRWREGKEVGKKKIKQQAVGGKRERGTQR